jgi:hypothetical protein
MHEQYDIVTSSDKDKFTKEINRLAGESWRVAHFSTASSRDGGVRLSALLKRDFVLPEEPEEEGEMGMHEIGRPATKEEMKGLR